MTLLPQAHLADLGLWAHLADPLQVHKAGLLQVHLAGLLQVHLTGLLQVHLAGLLHQVLDELASSPEVGL